MTEINKLFYDLIRVVIGNQVCLSHTPSAEEWGKLYAMAKKQSLVGICFAGVQRLASQQQAPPEMLYLQWMGMAAKIQQRNEVVSRQCVDLKKRFATDGYRTCILKGQGVASIYKVNVDSTGSPNNCGELSDLSTLRQSGDIDIWVDGDRDDVYSYLEDKGIKVRQKSYVEAFAEFYDDTVVEVHSGPTFFFNPKKNSYLHRYLNKQKELQFCNFNERLGFAHPTIEFNLVFLMIHIYRHVFQEGIGFRQLMDYYFVLCARFDVEELGVNDVICITEKLGLTRFAEGLMWVMQYIFGLPLSKMPWKSNDKYGLHLLELVLAGGNFGRYNSDLKNTTSKNRWKNGWNTLVNNCRNLLYYPDEVLCMPCWKLCHYIWRIKKGYINVKISKI